DCVGVRGMGSEQEDEWFEGFCVRLRQCRDCVYAETRNTVVCPEGPTDSYVVFIGEAPGDEEDRQGRPFVGFAGKILDGWLDDLGFPREWVYITNRVKCLRGNSLVWTEEGKKRINWLVKHQPGLRVWSVDEEGCPVLGTVTGYHRTLLNGRKLFKLILSGSRRNSQGAVGATMTEDHPVLTFRGWKLLQELDVFDQIHSGSLSPNHQLMEVLSGMLLGDAFADHVENRIGVTQSIKQRRYLNYKAFLFGAEDP
ncbi:unnamed protein product, partial [marine sediment metagenome]